MLNLTKIKTLYQQNKNLLDIIQEADRNDERYQLLLRSLTVQDVEQMQQFIKYCNDIGLPLILRGESN